MVLIGIFIIALCLLWCYDAYELGFIVYVYSYNSFPNSSDRNKSPAAYKDISERPCQIVVVRFSAYNKDPNLEKKEFCAKMPKQNQKNGATHGDLYSYSTLKRW